MREWKETELKKIGNVVSGGTPSTAIAEYWNGDILFVTPFDLSRNKFAFIENTERKISKEGLKNSSANFLPGGSIVISSRAPIGYIAIGKKDFVTNQGCKSVVPNSHFDSLYLYYCFNFYVERIKKLGAGSTFAEISKADLESVKFPHPEDKTEQCKIATILSTCDSLIEKTQAAMAKYKAIKQGMLNDLFTRGIDIKTGKLRPKYEDAPELYKDSKLGWVPKEWEDCKMGKYILENLYGPRFNANDYDENGKVKTIRGTDFTKEGDILYNQAPKASLPNELINTHRLRTGDIVIVTTADCGLTAVFDKPINDVEFIPSAYSVKYRFGNDINPYFIKYFMNTDNALRQVNKFVRQGTLGNLPGSDILKFDMVYPKTEEQNEIARRLKTIDDKLQTEQNYLQKLQQIRAGLMGDLLSGRKRVNI